MKYLAGLLLLLIVHEGAFLSIPQEQSFLEKSHQTLNGYVFTQGLDSGGNDIEKRGTDIQDLKTFCDSRSNCAAFNTNGWTKKSLNPRANWSRFSNAASAGTYVKDAIPIRGYEFVQGVDSNGNDIKNHGTILQDLITFCNSRTDCEGFNTNGWIKKILLPQANWLRFSDAPSAGTYVKLPEKADYVDGYFFVQGLDSPGGDIANKGTDLRVLKEFCNSRADCLGFNTNGWTKRVLLEDQQSWVRFSTNEKAGTYVKLPVDTGVSQQYTTTTRTTTYTYTYSS